jgi:hypothetical protein
MEMKRRRNMYYEGSGDDKCKCRFSCPRKKRGAVCTSSSPGALCSRQSHCGGGDDGVRVVVCAQSAPQTPKWQSQHQFDGFFCNHLHKYITNSPYSPSRRSSHSQRSTSPNTRSIVPIMATASARRCPLEIWSMQAKCAKPGARILQR